MSSENKQAMGQGFWKEHSAAWKSSGLTQLGYCEQHGLSYQSFVYQHNRINSQSKKTSLHFVEAKATLKEAPQAMILQLVLPNGIRLGIGSAVNASLLETVLSVAGRVSC